MIINKPHEAINVSISAEDKEKIKIFLQGMVYCWCKNVKDENNSNKWFFARDLVGGERFSWDDTPLKVLNENYDTVKTASQALGNLLYEVLDEDTKQFEGYTLGICFNYGGQQEIVNATRIIAEKVLNNELKVEDITKETIENYLYTAELGQVDLLIRTSGEERLSNFLTWQSAYSEFIFTKTLWPDFNKKELYTCIKEFQSRNRRFGGLENKNVK